MKKVLIIAALAAMFSVNAQAKWIKGAITEIKVAKAGIYIRVDGTRQLLEGTEDHVKVMYALALSAYLAGETVAANSEDSKYTEATIVK